MSSCLRSQVSPGHLPEGGHPDNVIELHPLDEDANEADEGELHEGEEDHGEAEHDIEVHGRDPTTRARLATSSKSEPDGDHCQHCGGAQPCPRRSLLPQLRLDQPEADPGAHHDDDQGRVHLEDIEPDGSVEGEGEEDDRPGGVPHTGVDTATVKADEMILRQLNVTQGSRGLCPPRVISYNGESF